MFQVFDCGKPADCFHCKNVHESWNKSAYDTFEEAKEYAVKWLGAYSNVIEFEWDGSPINYDGFDGDNIEIREFLPCPECKSLGYVTIYGREETNENCPLCNGNKVVTKTQIDEFYGY